MIFDIGQRPEMRLDLRQPNIQRIKARKRLAREFLDDLNLVGFRKLQVSGNALALLAQKRCHLVARALGGTGSAGHEGGEIVEQAVVGLHAHQHKRFAPVPPVSAHA